MNSFSLVANTIAVLSAAKVFSYGFEKINDLHTAPDAAYAVYNEISDVSLVVQHVKTTFQEHSNMSGISQPALFALGRSLDRARDVLLELNTIIDCQLLLQLNDRGKLSVNRFIWIRKKGRIRQLQDSLRLIKLDLTAGLTALYTYVLPGYLRFTLCNQRFNEHSVQVLYGMRLGFKIYI